MLRRLPSTVFGRLSNASKFARSVLACLLLNVLVVDDLRHGAFPDQERELAALVLHQVSPSPLAPLSCQHIKYTRKLPGIGPQKPLRPPITGGGFIWVIPLNVAAGQASGRAGHACDGLPRADARQPSLRAQARRAAPRWRLHSPRPPPSGRPDHMPGPKGPGLLGSCQSAAANLARARQGCERCYSFSVLMQGRTSCLAPKRAARA